MTNITPTSLLAMRSAILQQNSALAKAAENAAKPIAGVAETASPNGFSGAMNSALQQVNSLQSNADVATTAYEKGESTDIAAVMLAREKASVGFQATLQVRNKLLTAYKDIMSMPV